MKSYGNDKININNVFNVKYPMPTLRGHTVSYIYVPFNQLWLSGTEHNYISVVFACMYFLIIMLCLSSLSEKITKSNP